jgi:hypothetical protein
MGTVAGFPKSALIMGILSATNPPTVAIELELVAEFGPIETRSDPIPYTHSTYYNAEMGTPLTKQWVSFRIPESANPSFADFKLNTQAIETRHSIHGHRRYNVDPGLLFQHNLILLSTKNFAHRIPLQDGIYGEVELIYRNGTWTSLPWTYPDYQMVTVHDFLSHTRQRLLF